MLPEAGTREEIMGLEGVAARAYFQAWTACVDPVFEFTGRHREAVVLPGQRGVLV